MRLIGHLFPFENQPENHSRKQRGIGIHLALYRTEPEGVTKCIGQGAYHTTTHDRDQLPQRDFRTFVHDDLPSHVCDAPEEEQDRQSTEQGRHTIDHDRHLRRIRGELRKEVRCQHKERCSRRVSYLQLVGRRNELTAIPETCGRLHCHQINCRSDRKDNPPQHVVDQFIISHTLCYRYCFFSSD